ncbi:Peptidoglycan-associated lipoprotein (plasmid) [Caballeronia sp. SBC1]|uniref:OmpA family protein n=1 Tax=unclassified Caballeronia TaxID=2646786 RepID=UPI0013E17DCB|nr:MULTISPECIES: OmpA family protein [unclassified Caballeronia]QIE25914.1 Peptidoglycan-associated lipoprotein [Caballeronia sp. SBC2]QIN64773.1 Peptidoglycan-associated lipoprotein [Caballeronia sp. SBC1]
MKPFIRRHGRASAAAFVTLVFLCACSTPPDKIILLPDPEGKVGAVIVHSATGEQTINKAYAGVDVTKGGAIEKTMDSQSSVETRYAELLAARPPRPRTFTIFFLFDSATDLAPESLATVKQLKAVLATWPAPQLVVVGHTDLAGSQEWDDKLAMRRAETVAAFLIKQGIPARQIETAARGKREPLVHTADGVPNHMNRRVVITIQ